MVCDEATDGPWAYYVDATVMSTGCLDSPVMIHAPLCSPGPNGECDCVGRHKDSAFIAAARSDGPRLLDEVERLRAVIKELKAPLGGIK